MNNMDINRMLFARQGRASTKIIRRWLISWAVGAACGGALALALVR